MAPSVPTGPWQTWPPPYADPLELEAEATRGAPSLPGAWWISHQVAAHAFATIAEVDPRTGEPLPQSLADLLERLCVATEQGVRPFPHDRLFEVVQLAEEPLRHLLEHHRHRYERTHEQVPFHRYREMDVRSSSWLARRPGRSLREKLAGRTHALGVVRRETADTDENRLLRAFAQRFARRAALRSDHAGAYDQFGSDRNRLERLRAMLRLCGERFRRSELIEVPAPRQVRPNNVLLGDPDYARIHRAWRWLRDEDSELRRVWPDLLERVCTLLFWMVVARLERVGGVQMADSLARVVPGLGLERLEADGTPHWSLNPAVELLCRTGAGVPGVTTIRLEMQGQEIRIRVTALDGQGLLAVAGEQEILVEISPGLALPATGRGVSLELRTPTPLHAYADLEGLRNLADQIIRRILERCKPLEPGPAQPQEEHPSLSAGARLGLGLGRCTIHLDDGELHSKWGEAWSVAQDLPGDQGLAWLDGKRDRWALAGGAPWSLEDLLDPESEAEAGTMALVTGRIVRNLEAGLRPSPGTRVAFTVPDTMDVFAQKALRAAMSTSFRASVPIWRSVAAAEAWVQSPEGPGGGVQPGSEWIVVDVEFSNATLTLLTDRTGPTVGLRHWERRPPLPNYEELEGTGWASFLRAYAEQLVARAAGDGLDAEARAKLVAGLLRFGWVEPLLVEGAERMIPVRSVHRPELRAILLAHDPDLFAVEYTAWIHRLEEGVRAALRHALPGPAGSAQPRRFLLIGGPFAEPHRDLDSRPVGRLKVILREKGVAILDRQDGGGDVRVPLSGIGGNALEWLRPGDSMRFTQRPGQAMAYTAAPVRETGTLLNLDPDTISGQVKRDGGLAPALLSYTSVRRACELELCPGDRLSFEVGRDYKGIRAWNPVLLSRLPALPCPPTVLPAAALAQGARACLLKLEAGETAWIEWLPNLSMEVIRNGHFGSIPLVDESMKVDPFLGAAVEFTVREALTIPAGQRWISCPLVVGRQGQHPVAWEARFESPALPLEQSLRVRLKVAYRNGYDSGYALHLEPEIGETAPFVRITGRWSREGERGPQLEALPPARTTSGSWTRSDGETFCRLVSSAPWSDLKKLRFLFQRVSGFWSEGRCLANAPEEVGPAFATLCRELLAVLDGADPVLAAQALEILAALQEDAPADVLARVLALDEQVGDDPVAYKQVARLLSHLVGHGGGKGAAPLERLLGRLRRHSTIGLAGLAHLMMLNATLDALGVAAWRHLGLLSNLAERDGALTSMISLCQKSLRNLLTRVPIEIAKSEPAVALANKYAGPFRLDCELLLAILENPWVGGHQPLLAFGSVNATAIAKMARQLEAMFQSAQVDVRWRVHPGVRVPAALSRMSAVVCALNLRLVPGSGANLLQVVE